MHLHRVVLEWAGPPVVGRAVTVLHFDATEQPAPPVAAIKTAFTPNMNIFPSNVSITFPSSGDTIEDTTGELVGVWTSPDGGVVNATGDGGAAAGVGAVIAWGTGAIVSGTKGPRKLRGRTFLVPLSRSGFDGDGTLAAAWLNGAKAIANGLQASGGLAVWHRPTTTGGSDGGSGAVLSNNVRDRVAFLSSRRS